MKTSVIEVHDMLSVLSVDEVEKRIGEVPGVESVTVNYAAGNATVRYDETRLEVADIKSAVRQRGHESSAPAAASAGGGHEGHLARGTPPATPAPEAPTPPPGVPTIADGGTAPQNKTDSSATPKPSPTVPASAPAPTAPKSGPDAAIAAPAVPAGEKQQGKTAPDKS